MKPTPILKQDEASSQDTGHHDERLRILGRIIARRLLKKQNDSSDSKRNVNKLQARTTEEIK